MRLTGIGLALVGLLLLVGINVSTFGSIDADAFVNVIALVFLIGGGVMAFKGGKS